MDEPAAAARRGEGRPTSNEEGFAGREGGQPGGGGRTTAASAPGAASAPAVGASAEAFRRQVVLLLVFAVGLGVILYFARGALSPFVVGLVLVYLLDRPVGLLVRLGVPRLLAIPLVYAAVLVVLFEVLSLTLAPLVAQAQSFIRELPGLVQALDDQLRRIGEVYRGLDLPPELRAAVDAALADLAQAALRLDPTVLVPVVGSLASFVASLLGYLVIPIWVFYVLLDRRALTEGLRLALPAAWQDDAAAIGEIVRRVFGQWIRAQLVLGLIVGLATYVGLLLLGALIDPVLARYALLLAILAGTLELLPIIGPIISAVPAILVGATAGLEPMLAVFVLYLVIQQVENHLLVPKIQGLAIELHPSLVIFALVTGAAVAGLLGAILALPIAATARNVYRYLFVRLGQPPATVEEALATVAGPRSGAPTAGGGARDRPPAAAGREVGALGTASGVGVEGRSPTSRPGPTGSDPTAEGP